MERNESHAAGPPAATSQGPPPSCRRAPQTPFYLSAFLSSSPAPLRPGFACFDVEAGVFEADAPPGWRFIPVSPSPEFTLSFCAVRALRRKLLPWGVPDVAHFLAAKPRIDLKGALVLLNGGAIGGASLRAFSRKDLPAGSTVPEMFVRRDFAGVEKYIRDEKEAFDEVFTALAGDLKALGAAMKRKK